MLTSFARIKALNIIFQLHVMLNFFRLLPPSTTRSFDEYVNKYLIGKLRIKPKPKADQIMTMKHK